MEDGRSLETKISFEVLSDLMHKSLERKFADEQLSLLLVLPDLTKYNSTRTIAMRLLYSCCWGTLASSSLGGQLFP
jgi:hypothetical protein